jgi:hypothetical protein
MSQKRIEEETLTVLLDSCVNAHSITQMTSDKGRLLKKLKQLKDTYLLRKHDIFKQQQTDLIVKSMQEFQDALASFDEQVQE